MDITPQQAIAAIVEELNGKAFSQSARLGIACAISRLEKLAVDHEAQTKELADLKAKHEAEAAEWAKEKAHLTEIIDAQKITE
jgi:hypothetical protein